MTGDQNGETDGTSDKILDIATPLFLEYGFDAVSIDDIVSKARISKSTIYTYFDGKDGLFVAVVEKICAQSVKAFLDTLQDHPQVNSTQAAKQLLSKLAFTYLKGVTNPLIINAFRMCSYMTNRFSGAGRTYYSAGPQQTIKHFSILFEQWNDMELIRAGDCNMTAALFLGLLRSNFHIRALCDVDYKPSDEDMKEAAEEAVTILFDGVAA